MATHLRESTSIDTAVEIVDSIAAALESDEATASLAPSPYTDFLAGKSSETPPVQVRAANPGAPRFAMIRRWLRTASWSPITRLPRSLIAPEAVVPNNDGR